MVKDKLENCLENISNISDEEIKEYFDSLDRADEKIYEKFDSLLDFLIQQVSKKKTISSDEFYYKEDDCKPYNFRDFERFLYLLFDNTYSYAKRNCISTNFDDGDNIFCESSCCLKISDKFYTIKLIVGQGSYIEFSLIDNINVRSNCYVDYNNIFNDNGENKKECIKKEIINDVENIRQNLNLEKDVFFGILREYMNDYYK